MQTRRWYAKYGTFGGHTFFIFVCSFLKNSVDSYKRLIQPLETGTGLTFRSSRVRDEVSERSHRNRQLNLPARINDTFTKLNVTVTMISQVTALMPDAGIAKGDTAMALVTVTDGPGEDFIIYPNLKPLTRGVAIRQTHGIAVWKASR